METDGTGAASIGPSSPLSGETRFSPPLLESALSRLRREFFPPRGGVGWVGMTGRRRYCLRGHDTDAAGRDSSGRCLICKREAMWAARAPAREAAAAARAERAAAREAELERLERERIEERHRRQAEADRRREREYQQAIKAGGRVAAEARWWRASDETLEAGRYGLCQWEDEIDGEYTHLCFNRTRSDVYCSTHNRQLEREIERDRRQRAKEVRS